MAVNPLVSIGTTAVVTSIANHVNDAAFVTAKGSSAANGDIYFNTTVNQLRIFQEGNWQSARGSNALLTKTANYTITTADELILADASGGSITLTLPAASSSNTKVYKIKRLDSTIANTVTIARAGSDTLNDSNGTATSLVLYTMNEQYDIATDGSTAWYVVNHRTEVNLTLSLTTTGLGTLSSTGQSIIATRRGSWLKVSGYSVIGTTAASSTSLVLPTGYTIDTTKASSATNAQHFGRITRVPGSGVGSLNSPSTDLGPWHLFFDGSANTALFVGTAAGSTNVQFSKVNGTSICNSADGITFEFEIPVTNWKA